MEEDLSEYARRPSPVTRQPSGLLNVDDSMDYSLFLPSYPTNSRPYFLCAVPYRWRHQPVSLDRENQSSPWTSSSQDQNLIDRTRLFKKTMYSRLGLYYCSLFRRIRTSTNNFLRTGPYGVVNILGFRAQGPSTKSIIPRTPCDIPLYWYSSIVPGIIVPVVQVQEIQIYFDILVVRGLS
jgi:hypothetical protein